MSIPDPSPAADRLWRALAEPARRHILDLLRLRPRRTGDLAAALEDHFAVSRFMTMKHLKLLTDAGLVLVNRKGRERWNHLNAVPIQELYRRWIEPFAAVAADSLLRLRRRAESSAATTPSPSPDSTGVPLMSDPTFEVHDVVVEVQIDAPREKVWKTLTDDTSAWWPRDYYVSPEGASFRIEPRVGGFMLEDYGDGEGTMWATVTHVKRNESMRLSAEVWPEFGGPARSIQRYSLADHEGGTLLRFTDTMYGRVTADNLKSMTEGWNYLIGRAFKDYVETGAQPPETSPLSC